jgi:hypothetical protein
MKIVDQEWANAEQIQAQFGLTPSYLKKLAKENKIRSTLLRNPAARKGVRLYNIVSIRDLIAQNEN